jgi:uncharacterized protein (DUF1499 family)
MAGMAWWSRGRPAAPGLLEDRLAPCPSSPNCVCSQEADPGHGMEPIAMRGTEADALTRLIAVLESQPDARIVAVKGPYVHAEFTTSIFGFVDDVEFLIDGESRVIHFRSASRVGSYDFGANRKRMERLRTAFAARK